MSGPAGIQGNEAGPLPARPLPLATEAPRLPGFRLDLVRNNVWPKLLLNESQGVTGHEPGIYVVCPALQAGGGRSQRQAID